MYDKFFKDLIELLKCFSAYYPEPKKGEFKNKILSFLEHYYPLDKDKKWDPNSSKISKKYTII